MQETFQKIAQSKMFGNFITVIIVIAGAIVGLETEESIVLRFGDILHIFDKIILAIFIAEVVIKIGAQGKKPWNYFKDGWNIFDFSIVVAALMPFGGSSVAVLRLFRLLRVLRLVTAIPKLQLLVNALLKSIPSMGYVSVLLMLLFYVYAVAGVIFFSKNDPVYFGDIGASLITLFRIVTLEGWSEILYIEMRGCASFGYDDMKELCTHSQAQPIIAVIYFVSYILVGTMVLLNLFIGVIMNGMEEAKEETDELNAQELSNEDKKAHDLIKELKTKLHDAQELMSKIERSTKIK